MNDIKPKEFSEYGDQRNDYANGEELMVEITLAEYRELIIKNATSEHTHNKLRLEKIELERQIRELKEQIVNLKAVIVKGEDGTEAKA